MVIQGVIGVVVSVGCVEGGAEFLDVRGGGAEVESAEVGLLGHMLPVVFELELADLAIAAVTRLHFEPHLLDIPRRNRRPCILRLHLLGELAAFGSRVRAVVGLHVVRVTLSAGRRKEGVK